MKRYFKPLVACWMLFAALATRVYGQPPEQPVGIVDGEPLRKFDFQISNGTIDDHIVELARQADANFIADATRFPQPSEPISTRSNDYLGHFILALAHHRDLTWTKYGKRTFLFWADQDMWTLARKILTEEEAKGGIKNLDANEMADWFEYAGQLKTWSRDIAPALNDYFKQAHGWDGLSTDFKLKVKVADLPPNLRTLLLTRMRTELLRPDVLDLERAWFNDDTWQKLVLRVRATVRDGKALTLSGAGVGNVGQSLVIGSFSGR